MSHSTLPYLQYLQSTVVTLSMALKDNPALTMPCTVAGRLVDRMVVEQTTAPQLQAEYYAALLKVLPAAEALLNADAVSALKTICATSDTREFGRFQRLCGDLQRSLLALGTPPALAQVKIIAQLEADYILQFDAALAAQSKQAASDGKTASGARHSRDIDQKALLEFIKRVYPQETELVIKETRAVSGGYSKFTVAVTLENAKALPRDIILRGDASATFGGTSVVDEYRLIKTMYENGVSVPAPIALEQSGEVFGSPFLLVEKNPGIVIGHMFKLPTTPNAPLLKDIAAKLAAIHRVPLAAVGEQIDGVNSRSSDKALAWIDEGLKAWRPLDMPSTVFETAFDWLRRNAAVNDKAPRTLVHGDYGLNNLLIDNDKVSTVLDWEFAHIGNPAYDLGYFHFMAKSLGPWEEFLQAYGAAGMPVPDEEQLNYNILLAATRLGVMVSQVSGLFLSGAEPGLAGAATISDGCYEETIKRIAGTLQRVL